MKYLAPLVILVILVVACKNTKSKSNSSNLGITKVEKTTALDSDDAKSDKINAEVSKDNMVYFEGGTFLMGRNNGLPQEAPAHEVRLKSFYIDKYLVTVKDFRTFIKATAYVTEAERFGDSGVFDFETGQWSLKPGTTWEYPLGPEEAIAKDDHPVTHVSWRDAMAFAKWKGKRLVEEAEWEYAARNGGLFNDAYTWGNELKPKGKWLANVFQGTIQDYKLEDGYLYTSPVGAFGESSNGLSDMSGNVWEWMADVYRPYVGNEIPFRENPDVRSTRGGSFMYDAVGELSYTVYFRSSNSAETSLFNTGFRCALSADKVAKR